MHFLFRFLFDHPLVSLAQTAFTVWMLVDSYRRRAEYFWFFVILWLQPVGPWVYFFVVVARDFSGVRGLTAWSFGPRRPSLAELRYRAEHTPTLATHLELAQRLIERGEHADAVPHLEAALAQEPDHCQVLYSLAVCRRALGRPEEAAPLLERINARDRTWSDYSAWRLLAEVRGDTGDGAGALSCCRELVRLAPTLRHQCLLAENLLRADHSAEAGKVLDEALDSYRYAPGIARRRNRRWVREARRLRRQASAG